MKTNSLKDLSNEQLEEALKNVKKEIDTAKSVDIEDILCRIQLIGMEMNRRKNSLL